MDLSTLSLFSGFATLGVMELLRNRYVVFFIACLVIASLSLPLFDSVVRVPFITIFVTASMVVSIAVIGVTAGIVASHLGGLAYPQFFTSVLGTVFIAAVMLFSGVWAADCVLPHSGIDPNLLCRSDTERVVHETPETQSATIIEQGGSGNE